MWLTTHFCLMNVMYQLNEEKRRSEELLDIRGFCRYGPWVKDRSKRGSLGSKQQQLRKQNPFIICVNFHSCSGRQRSEVSGSLTSCDDRIVGGIDVDWLVEREERLTRNGGAVH